MEVSDHHGGHPAADWQLGGLRKRRSWGEGCGIQMWVSSLLWPLGAQKSPGANGVAFFFVLSGFVEWLPSVENTTEERALPTDEGLLAFWLRRGSRILEGSTIL